MTPGKFKAYPRRQGAVAFTGTQGKGDESMHGQGKADPSVTVYQEQLNDTSQSKINGFVERAAAALSVVKSELIIEDARGRKKFGHSIQDGSNIPVVDPVTS